MLEQNKIPSFDIQRRRKIFFSDIRQGRCSEIPSHLCCSVFQTFRPFSQLYMKFSNGFKAEKMFHSRNKIVFCDVGVKLSFTLHFRLERDSRKNDLCSVFWVVEKLCLQICLKIKFFFFISFFSKKLENYFSATRGPKITVKTLYLKLEICYYVNIKRALITEKSILFIINF